MRGTLDGLDPPLDTPHPMGLLLPALYQDDGMAQRLVGALDNVLAPVFCTLDGLECYVDPRMAPADFVEWLAGWVGVVFDEAWPLERRREIAARAVALHRRRGTAVGIRDAVRLVVEGDVEIFETGAAAWSEAPGGQLPGQDPPALLVRVHSAEPAAVDEKRLDALVGATKPAHVPHRVEVVAGSLSSSDEVESEPPADG
jgi:phage tail-like protein